MEKLICEDIEIEVKDYIKDKKMYTFDIKFNSKDEFDNFLTYYEKYEYGKGIFHFVIGENNFDGWFGSMLYDHNYNVRLYVAVYDNRYREESVKYGLIYNHSVSTISIGNAIRELCEILKKNNVLNTEDLDMIIEMLNTPKTLTEFRCLVYDLPTHLKENRETIEDLRKSIEKL